MSEATRRQEARQVADEIIQKVVSGQQAYYEEWLAAWTAKLLSAYAHGPHRKPDELAIAGGTVSPSR